MESGRWSRPSAVSPVRRRGTEVSSHNASRSRDPTRQGRRPCTSIPSTKSAPRRGVSRAGFAPSDGRSRGGRTPPQARPASNLTQRPAPRSESASVEDVPEEEIGSEEEATSPRLHERSRRNSSSSNAVDAAGLPWNPAETNSQSTGRCFEPTRRLQRFQPVAASCLSMRRPRGAAGLALIERGR